MEGNDHKVSLLPGEFKEMVERVREVEAALGTASPRAVSTGEMMNRVNLAKSLVAARRIEAGELITADAVDIKSPGRGLQPNAYDRLVGRTAQHAFESGDFFYATDLGDAAPTGRQYAFRRPVGPARPLPRRRGDDEGHALPTSSSSTSPTRTSSSTSPRSSRRTRRRCRWATPATAPTCSPATSCSTSPATTTSTGSARSPSSSGSST